MSDRITLLELALRNANLMITDVSNELGAIILKQAAEIKRIRARLCEHCECRLFHHEGCSCTRDE